MLTRVLLSVAVTSLAAAQSTTHVSTLPGGNFGWCSQATMSADGELVAFHATGTSLGGGAGIYLWRRSTNQHDLIAPGASIWSQVARDGGHVVWTTSDNSLDDGEVFLHDVAAGTTLQVSVDGSGQPLGGRNASPSVSADGRFVAFVSNQAGAAPGHPGVVRHIVMRDVLAGTSYLASVNSNGVPANGPSDFPSVSDDGQVVAFTSFATNLSPGDNFLTDSFVRDQGAGTTRILGIGEAPPRISGDGRFVAFTTSQSLAPEDTFGGFDVYVVDRDGWDFEVVSVDPATGFAGGGSLAGLSRHGRFVAFSAALPLLPEDQDQSSDVYLRDRLLDTTTFLTPAYDGGASEGAVFGNPGVSDDGRFAVFVTNAPRLVQGDNESVPDVFQRDIGEQLLGAPFCDPAVANSTGVPAVATASGSALAADNSFGLSATQLPVHQSGYFILGQTTGITQTPGGSPGTLCLVGTIGRLASQVQSSGSGGALFVAVDLTALPLPLQPAVLAGETWAFQCWYRDVNPTPTSNFTDAVVVSFL